MWVGFVEKHKLKNSRHILIRYFGRLFPWSPIESVTLYLFALPVLSPLPVLSELQSFKIFAQVQNWFVVILRNVLYYFTNFVESNFNANEPISEQKLRLFCQQLYHGELHQPGHVQFPVVKFLQTLRQVFGFGRHQPRFRRIGRFCFWNKIKRIIIIIIQDQTVKMQNS